MIRLHRILAYVLAALVLVQTAAVVWGVDGEGRFVENGGVITKTMMDDHSGPVPFPEELGFKLHGINGSLVIPVVALALLVVSLFARTRGAVMWSAIVLGLIVVQVALGFGQHALPLLGLLHGPNALLIFGAAVLTGVRSKPSRAASGVSSARSTEFTRV